MAIILKNNKAYLDKPCEACGGTSLCVALHGIAQTVEDISCATCDGTGLFPVKKDLQKEAAKIMRELEYMDESLYDHSTCSICKHRRKRLMKIEQLTLTQNDKTQNT